VGVENKMKNKIWTEPEIQIVRNNFLMSLEELSELLGRSESSVLNMKYKLKNQGFKYEKNYVWDFKRV
jgi:DNA-binding Lrp family transcriptional regulator